MGFAHRQGVIHRDLKPDNVMVGEFGEVYVVDWGIALEVEPGSDPPRYPAPSPWVGSPAYLAPEMIEPDVVLSEQTDIYLIGGMLFEILAGKPPHSRPGRENIEASIAGSPPALPHGVEPELADIVSKAMAFRPEDRFESVEALQQALRDYMHHRVSRRLSAAANPAPFYAAIASGDDDDVRARYEEHLTMLRLALEGWRENPQALKAKDDATERLIRYELRRGRAEHATALLAGMGKVPKDLERECHVALTNRETGQHRGLDHLSPGGRARLLMVAVGAFVSISLPLLKFALGWSPTFERTGRWHLAGHPAKECWPSPQV